MDKLFRKYPKDLFVLTILVVVLSAVVPLSVALVRSSTHSDTLAAENSQITTTFYTGSRSDVFNQDGLTVSSADENAWIGTGKNTSLSYLGLLFHDGLLPAGVNVIAATLSITPASTQWIQVSTAVSIEDNNNPLAFSSQHLPSDRQLVSGSQLLSDNVKWIGNTTYTLDVTNAFKNFVSTSSRSQLALIVAGRGSAYGRKFIYSTGQFAPKLTITYQTGITSLPTVYPTAVVPTTVVVSPTKVTGVPTTVPTGMVMPTPATGNSAAFGIWTPNTKYDTCTKAFHDSFKVQGPDGKWYPTWHPASAVDPATGKLCTFGHEHGRDPSQFPDWEKVKEYFAYDANHDGTINAAEKAKAGVPFGYVNEQLDVYNQAKNLTVMRHEDHVGHKIEWQASGDVFVHAGPGDTARHSVAKCNYFSKLHQGTHSKDAFENNLHEVFAFINCPAEGYDIRIAKMVAFGAAGEFAAGLPCDPRGTIIKTGFDFSNPSYPGVTGRGTREIAYRNCLSQYFLVPSGKFSTNVYELWIGDSSITASGGKVLVRNPAVQFAVFDPIRFYDPGKTDNLGHLQDLCYETESNGDKAHGQPCDQLHGKIVSWDDPQAIFKDAKREVYFSAGPIKNSGGSTTWYADPYGNNAQTTPFTGSVKEFIVSRNIDLGVKYGGVVDTSAYGSDRPYGNGNGVHAPN